MQLTIFSTPSRLTFFPFAVMREWSILAIRNACFKCPEAQQVIAQLTLQGAAPNDLLSELNLDLGALRITDRKQ